MRKNEASMISGTLAAAEFAQQTEARRLILAHQGPNLDKPGSKERGIADVAGIFKGEIIFGEESMILDI